VTFAESPIADWSRAAAPPPALTVSEWADRERMLPEASAAQGGRWRTATAPYLAGIMDAFHEPGVTKIALCKCHQSGGSEAVNNIIGYCIAHQPAPMLLVHPTAGAAEAYSKERLADMIRTTPALRAVVQDKRIPGADGRPESTLSLKMFPGGFLALGGANTPNTFARWAARVAIGDDVDRFPAAINEEGDPADLLVNRTTTFHDGLSIFVSTPVLKGGRIDTLYRSSDQRRYFVPCPECGHEDFITWSDPKHFRVGFDDRDPESARIECPVDAGGCGRHIVESERQNMMADGEWRPTRTADTKDPHEPGLVGFHVPAMLSPWVSLPELVGKFLVANARGRESLKVFVNTALGEGWEDKGARIEPHSLLSRRESYGDGIQVPAAAPCLTAGVDVQVDRFELQVFGWGPGHERWVVDWRSIPGDPKRAETRAALLEALAVRYRHASGHMLPIHGTCIDSGYATDEVYDFVLANQHRRIYATKGMAGKSGEPIVGKPSEKTRGNKARPVRLYVINVDDAKTEVLSSLALVAPGPGYTHFMERVDEEYFSQLCAEHKEPRANRAGVNTHVVWVQHRERNEALDTAVLALAAFRLLNPNLRHMAELLAATPPGAPPEEGGGGGPATPPADGGRRRVSHSGYLGR
jgi:phage terminase large subunit GpA-like protein